MGSRERRSRGSKQNKRKGMEKYGRVRRMDRWGLKLSAEVDGERRRNIFNPLILASKKRILIDWKQKKDTLILCNSFFSNFS